MGSAKWQRYKSGHIMKKTRGQRPSCVRIRKLYLMFFVWILIPVMILQFQLMPALNKPADYNCKRSYVTQRSILQINFPSVRDSNLSWQFGLKNKTHRSNHRARESIPWHKCQRLEVGVHSTVTNISDERTNYVISDDNLEFGQYKK